MKAKLLFGIFICIFCFTFAYGTSSIGVTHLKKSGDLESILSKDKMVFVDFYADWCGPCKKLSPILESLAKENHDKIEVVKVNVDQLPDLATKYGVSSIPDLRIFQNGQEAAKLIGLYPKENYEGYINYLSSPSKDSLMLLSNVDSYKKEVMTGKAMAVTFFAPHLSESLSFLEIMDKVKSEVGQVDFYKANVDQFHSILHHFKIQELPAVVFIKNKNLSSLVVGDDSKDKLTQEAKKIAV